MVEALGAGIQLRPRNLHPEHLQGLAPEDVPRTRDAIRAVLDDDTYTRGAEAAARDLSQRPTVTRALHDLTHQHPPTALNASG